MRLFRSVLSTAACLTIGVVAAGSCTTSTDPVPIASISLLPGLDSIELGETYDRWAVILKDANNETLTGRALSWESLNPGVASIDASTGVVTGVSSGHTLIIVRAGGQEANAGMKVLQPVLSILVIPDSFDLPMTTTSPIGVRVVGPNGVTLDNRAIIWSSDNPGVAVVSTTGVVTPVSLGTTTITIRVADKQANVRVRVIGEPVAFVRITPVQAVHVIRLGQSKQLGVECLSASQQVLTGRPVTWVSSNPVVASVSGTGLVTGLVVGSSNVGVSCDNISGSVTVHVTPIPVASVTISPTTLQLQPGHQGQLNVTARDSAGNALQLTNRLVQWFSNNIPVAAVNTVGVVFASNTGQAEVTAAVDDVLSAPVVVTVQNFFAMMAEPLVTRERAPWLAVSEKPDR